MCVGISKMVFLALTKLYLQPFLQLPVCDKNQILLRTAWHHVANMASFD